VAVLLSNMRTRSAIGATVKRVRTAARMRCGKDYGRKSLSYWPQRIFYRGSGTPVEWYEQIKPAERVGPLLLINIAAGSTLHSSNCSAGPAN
jgi:hypothetical protein